MICSRFSAVVLVASIAALMAGCNSATTSTTGPSPVKCAVALTPPQNALDAVPGSGAVTVETTAECAWTATEDATWITGLSPASGQGNGAVQFQVSANPASAIRQADININGILARVTQSGIGCTLDLSPTSQTVGAGGGAGTVAVNTPAGCAWTATSGAPWLTISSGASGSGSGSVGFTAASNPGVARVGTLTIGGQAFAVTQPAAAAVPCINTIQPTSFAMSGAGGATTVTIQANPECSWTAASNAPWLAIVGLGVGSGNGVVSISASPNAGASRTGTLTIAGQTFTVTQAGSCAATLNPTSAAVGAPGATGLSVAVTTATGCAWTATTVDTWITITAGASGSGNGIVTYNVAANAGAARTGTLTIAGQTFTVTQAGSCTVSLNPTSAAVGVAGATNLSVSVTTAAGCAWTATTADTWITITAGASGSGNGAVTYDVAANAGAARTGSVTIAGQAFTVTQAGSCLASLNPASATVGLAGATGLSVAVTTAAGCAWTATKVDTWITITAGASGSGNGTVTYNVAANSGGPRVGTITIAGQAFAVNQAGSCASTIGSASQSVPAAGGPATPVAVTSPAGCAWTATTGATWISISSGASGTGNGTVVFSVAANVGPLRTDTITIAGQTHTVTQANGCVYAINPTSQSFGKNGGTSGAIAVTTAAGCTWTSTSNDSWITVTLGASGSGNGTVRFTVASNGTDQQRTGTLTIAGRTFTVTQNK